MEINTDTAPTARFEVGKTYSTRSACNYDTIFSWTVVKRTDKTITVVEDMGKHCESAPKRVKIQAPYRAGDAEWALPDGRYSMAPTISADKFDSELPTIIGEWIGV